MPKELSMTLQDAVIRWCQKNNVQLSPKPKKLYALPNGEATTSREEAYAQRELHSLMRNVVKNNNSRKLQYCIVRS